MIPDQAEGLRRLLVQDSLRIIAVTSGITGAGKTATVINLAAALSRSGKDVLIIDENAGANNLGGTLGLNAHRDLLDVVRRDKTLDEVIIAGPEGIRLLPAGRGLRVLGKLSPDDQAHLIESFRDFARPMDVVLVDATPVRGSQLLSLTASSPEIVVVVSSQPTSITAAYSLIKNISGDHGTQQFRVLVNQVGTEAEAQMIFDNMAKAATRYLEVSLDFVGFVPTDDKLRQSIRSGRPVIQAFPAAASAAAFRRAAESLTRLPCRENEDKSQGKGLEGLMQRMVQGGRSTRIDSIAAGHQVNHV
jgi:flagellar biosynthesis protein FlhG